MNDKQKLISELFEKYGLYRKVAECLGVARQNLNNYIKRHNGKLILVWPGYKVAYEEKEE